MKPKAYLNGKIVKQGAPETMTNLLVTHGKISGLGYIPDEDEAQLEQVDLKDCFLFPDVTDLTPINFGDPEKKVGQTLFEMARSGGVTRLLAFPNVGQGRLCSAEDYSAWRKVCESNSQIRLSFSAPAFQDDTLLAEIGLYAEAGCRALIAGQTISDSQGMAYLLKYSQMFDLPIFVQAMDQNLSGDGSVHEGEQSFVLGLPGIPSAAETTAIARDLALLAAYGGRLHFHQISTGEGVQQIARAKSDGLQVTCSVGLSHLFFTDQDLGEYDSEKKVIPPFRTEQDRLSLIEGLKSGVIDCVVSGHSLFSNDQKVCEFSQAVFGISTLEDFLPRVIEKLHLENGFSLAKIHAFISVNPRKILGESKSCMGLGQSPNFSVWDPAVHSVRFVVVDGK